MKKLAFVFLLLSIGFLLKAQVYSDVVKIKHVLTNTHLHSHAISFGHPQSSGQQQVTAYGGADDNDLWTMTEIKSTIKDNTPGSLVVRIIEKDGRASKSPRSVTVKILDNQGEDAMLYNREVLQDGRILYQRVPPGEYTIKCSQLFTSGPGANEDAFSNSREVFLSPSELRITISPGKETMVEFKKVR